MQSLLFPLPSYSRLHFFEQLWSHRKAEAERQKVLARIAEKARNERAKAAGGFTADNIHYFDTKAELDDYADLQHKHSLQLAASLMVRCVMMNV